MNSGVLYPPLAPTSDEREAVIDPQLAQTFRDEAVQVAQGDVCWEVELVTRSERWGVIWRADFSEPERWPLASPARVMRWKADNGTYSFFIAIGRHEPLRLLAR